MCPRRNANDAEKDLGPTTTNAESREGAKDTYLAFPKQEQVHDDFCLSFGSCPFQPRVFIDPLGSGTQK